MNKHSETLPITLKRQRLRPECRKTKIYERVGKSNDENKKDLCKRRQE
jgi:hypothetical protein